MAMMKNRKTANQPIKKSEQKESEGVTLEQALKEEGEGRTPETISQKPKKTDGSSKAERARKIMEEMWEDLQAGKVKRKDVILRFQDEVGLTKAGASTYYGNIKKKMSKVA